MANATLLYVIDNGNNAKNLKLITESLFNLDKYTCNFKNEQDFINNFQDKKIIDNFVKENGKVGHVVINYSKSLTEKKQILPLFDSQDIFVFKNDPYEGKITEVERARRLLFNSKNQLFVKLVLSLNILDEELNNLIELDDKEVSLLCKSAFKPLYINNGFYISFKTLFEYRLSSAKLGCLRRVYEDMLNILKNKMEKLDSNSYYYYNRQLRIAINRYNDLVSELSVNNLKIKKINNIKYKLCCKNIFSNYLSNY